MFAWSSVFSSNTSAEQETPDIIRRGNPEIYQHRRRHEEDDPIPPNYSTVADTVAADNGHQTTPLVGQTVPLDPPPSYTEVCESMPWTSHKNG